MLRNDEGEDSTPVTWSWGTVKYKSVNLVPPEMVPEPPPPPVRSPTQIRPLRDPLEEPTVTNITNGLETTNISDEVSHRPMSSGFHLSLKECFKVQKKLIERTI